MGLEEGRRIFVFDSKDMWMKRVLVGQGWQENANKESKAFDLFWGNKPYKHRVYGEQKVNHYLNSDLVTSKIGLHRLLGMYKLARLQPRTFDLSTEQ
jgi:stress response protein SCP2